MRIRIKVKHLMLAAASALAFLTLLFTIIIPKMELYLAQKHLRAGDPASANAILHLINAPLTSSKKKWELIRSEIIENGPDRVSSAYDVYVGPNSSQVSGGSNKLTIDWQLRLPYLEDYAARGPLDGYMVRAVKQLAYYYNRDGQLQRAIQVLEEGENRLKSGEFKGQRKDLMLERAKLLLTNNADESAEQLIKLMKADQDQLAGTDFDWNGELALLQTEIWIRSGKIQEALDTITAELIASTKAWSAIEDTESGKTDHGIPGILEQMTAMKKRLEQVLQQKNGSISSTSLLSVVTGTVKKSNGEPMSGVGVFLRDQSAVNHSVVEGEPYQTITDDQGRFTFAGVLPNSYQLYLGLNFEQIDGYTWPVSSNEWLDVKADGDYEQHIVLQPLLELQQPVDQQIITDQTIHFKWEKVPGAAYYELNATLPIKGGSVGTTLLSKIKDNYVQLSSDELYEHNTGLSYEKSGDWASVEPATLLGFANTENRYSWSVSAFDADGHLITRSNGYRLKESTFGKLPFFYLKERTMTAADLLLMKGQVNEALAGYKQAYEGDPQDIHSLRMIIRMLQSKASIMRDNKADAEAISFLKRKVALAPTANDLFNLCIYYYGQEDWIAFQDYYEQYNRLPKPYTDDSYSQSIYATALMREGKLAEARVQFAKIIPADASHRFVGNYLAVEVYSTGSYDSAISIAEKYPERLSGQDDRYWYTLLKQVKLAADGSASYQRELKEKLDWYFGGKQTKTKLEAWIEGTSTDSAMKTFLQALLKVN